MLFTLSVATGAVLHSPSVLEMQVSRVGVQGDVSAAKRSKTVDSAASSEVNVSSADSKLNATSTSTADSKSQHCQAEQAADQRPEHSPRKENYSPNYEPAQALLEQQFGLPSDFDCTVQQSSCGDQASSSMQAVTYYSEDSFEH